MRTHAALGLAVALSMVSASASAQEEAAPAREPTDAEIAEARHSFEVASTAFDQGDYETAASEFRAAYALLGDPDLLFNVYLAEERAGRPREALEALEQHVARATMTAEQRALMEQRIVRLRERVARMDAGTQPQIDDARESAGDVPLALDAQPATPRTPPPEPIETRPPAAAIAMLVTGGVLLLAFGGLAIASELEDQSLASSCGRDAGRFCSAERVSTLEALNVAADASWIAAAVAGALGITFLFAFPPERSAPQVAVAPWMSPEGAGIAAGARF
ncbi:hypothetical protein DB32_002044 [Sandaracinus amylolyticus]|uniref:Tetratricopeptide repeat protein n=2 Tax=Sandaracinus amylolyticus TaxID=927083 RepID=A0A0F6YIB1_9BACT|nr:hypothetical protein DB32_002044 [Sandaracinus amylolyticus]